MKRLPGGLPGEDLRVNLEEQSALSEGKLRPHLGDTGLALGHPLGDIGKQLVMVPL